MSDYIISREELFDPVDTNDSDKPKEKRLKEKIGVSKTETVNQLCCVQSITVFGDIFLAISKMAQDNQINLYVYRRDRGEKYKHRYYWGIFAVKAGIPKANHPKELTNVIASIEDYPHQVNYRKNSRQYTLLQTFVLELESAVH